MCRFISGRAHVAAKNKLSTINRLLKFGAPTPRTFISSWNARNSSGVALSGVRPRIRVKSRIPRRYIVCVFGCSPLICMSSGKRRRSAGTYWSDIETSCRQIEKVPIVQQVRQFTKSPRLDQRASPATCANTARAVSPVSAFADFANSASKVHMRDLRLLKPVAICKTDQRHANFLA